MLRTGTLTVAGVNIDEEASELFAPGLLHCFTFIQLVSTNCELIFQSETSTSGAIWILYSGYASLTSLYMI